eukprot:TRINITY_DN24829_c0_g1_i3.p1 TRINITY_DN24829_c0_g1~~TRINITY_DN24829_c0_g1_i3.p1  ORF type:complete len:101 (-),score=4.32 TRINITY_DN24829_c0_g1_i3:104-406(-)
MVDIAPSKTCIAPGTALEVAASIESAESVSRRQLRARHCDRTAAHLSGADIRSSISRRASASSSRTACWQAPNSCSSLEPRSFSWMPSSGLEVTVIHLVS